MKGFRSVFLVTDRYYIDSSIIRNGSHPYLIRKRFTQNTQRNIDKRPSRMGVTRSRGLSVWLIICIYLYISLSIILHFPFGFIFHLHFASEFSSDYDELVTIDPNSIDYTDYVSRTLFQSHCDIIHSDIYRERAPTRVVRGGRADSDASLR